MGFVKTVRRFFNNVEAEFARSLLVSVGIAAVLAEENVNTLGPGFAPGGVRLQVPDEEAARAIEILNGGQEEFTPLSDDFVPPEEMPSEAEAIPPRLEGFGKVRGLIPVGLCMVAAMGAVFALYMLLAPLSWTHSSAELVRMGNAAARAKDYARAVKCYDAALIVNPRNYVAYYDRGLSFFDEKDYMKALADFTEAIHFNARHTRSYNMRGCAYIKMGNYDKAIEDLNRAIRLAPEQPNGYNYLAWFYATCPKTEMRDGVKALELATKACNLSEWKKSYYIGTLAAAEAETGNFADAVKHAQQALEMAKADKMTDGKMLDQMAEALAEYQQKRPYRDLEK